MALQSSGPISFSQIESEFGRNGGRSLGNYRVSDNYVSSRGGSADMANLPLDSGIPQSGAIAFSQFYNKRLNMVVDYYSGGSTRYRVDGRRKYNNRPGDVRCVGGFRTRPSNSSGTKVFLHVNVPIGSEKSQDRTRCAMRTGNWEGNTDLHVDVGSSGMIVGAGGNGGKGRVCDGGRRGKNGTSGLGIQYTNGTTTVRVFSGGRIQAGYAGGGGGGGGHNDPDKNTQDHASSGGGGGGGAGLPAGNGGPRGDGAFGKGDNGNSGSNGSITGRGGGGGGGGGGGSSGGNGGNGAAPGQNAGGGGGGSGNVCRSGGTGSGSSGDAIRKVGGANFTLSNSGTVRGGTSGSGVS